MTLSDSTFESHEYSETQRYPCQPPSGFLCVFYLCLSSSLFFFTLFFSRFLCQLPDVLHIGVTVLSTSSRLFDPRFPLFDAKFSSLPQKVFLTILFFCANSCWSSILTSWFGDMPKRWTPSEWWPTASVKHFIKQLEYTVVIIRIRLHIKEFHMIKV